MVFVYLLYEDDVWFFTEQLASKVYLILYKIHGKHLIIFLVLKKKNQRKDVKNGGGERSSSKVRQVDDRGQHALHLI
jgi:hypothetical protein